MRDVATKADGVDSLAAGDFNATQTDLENAITSTDQTLDPAGGADTDLNMTGKAMAGYAGAGWGYTDSGAVDAHVVAIASNLKPPTKYFDNMVVAYIPNGTNTSTTVTTNVASLGAKNIRVVGGGLPPIGSITADGALILKYNDGGGYFEIMLGTVVNAHSHDDPANGADATFFKVGSFTRDLTLASGTQAVTGVGFKPKALIFFANKSVTSGASWGVSDGTTDGAIYDNFGSSVDTYDVVASALLYLQTGAIFYTGDVQSLDSDGFTIDWTKTGATVGTFTIKYLAIR